MWKLITLGLADGIMKTDKFTINQKRGDVSYDKYAFSFNTWSVFC